LQKYLLLFSLSSGFDLKIDIRRSSSSRERIGDGVAVTGTQHAPAPCRALAEQSRHVFAHALEPVHPRQDADGFQRADRMIDRRDRATGALRNRSYDGKHFPDAAL
jgi:hypothetical protein